mmetsp:Transcript_25775/g.40764  ORF Transcript_25775/g.40764 Transcript_25775/m.40764 type:complete len:81 (-) Transcript_25775:69-311(-)
MAGDCGLPGLVPAVVFLEFLLESRPRLVLVVVKLEFVSAELEDFSLNISLMWNLLGALIILLNMLKLRRVWVSTECASNE